MGAVTQVDPLRPYDALVVDYMRAVKSGKSALVICPTHKQGDDVTTAIREKLRQTGHIGKKEITATRLRNLNYTDAEKADWNRFAPGHLVQFNQNQTGFQRGSRWTVKNTENGTVRLHDANGREAILLLTAAKHYDVMHKSEILLSKGDKLHVTRGAFDDANKRLNNGTALEVLSVSKNGKRRRIIFLSHSPPPQTQNSST